MFENLTEKLQRAFKNLRGQGSLTAENMEEALKEIRLALLEADVNFKVVKDLTDHIRAKAAGTEVMTALSPAEQVKLEKLLEPARQALNDLAQAEAFGEGRTISLEQAIDYALSTRAEVSP